MKAALKTLCQLSISKYHGNFACMSSFIATAREIIEYYSEKLESEAIIVFVSNSQVSSIIEDMGFLENVLSMEADGVLNRQDFIHDGFFYCDDLLREVDRIVDSEVVQEQIMRFSPY